MKRSRFRKKLKDGAAERNDRRLGSCELRLHMEGTRMHLQVWGCRRGEIRCVGRLIMARSRSCCGGGSAAEMRRRTRTVRVMESDGVGRGTLRELTDAGLQIGDVAFQNLGHCWACVRVFTFGGLGANTLVANRFGTVASLFECGVSFIIRDQRSTKYHFSTPFVFISIRTAGMG